MCFANSLWPDERQVFLCILNDGELNEKLRFINNTLGGILSPFDSFLLQRGIKTLGVRLDRHQSNANTIAEYLERNDAVKEVFYPALKSSKGYEIQKAQAKGGGAVISFRFNEDRYDLQRFVSGLRLFSFAVSLGGVESLICRPSTMTHESYSPALQEKIGITPNLIRLSVGLEDVDDLVLDLDNAVTGSKK